MAMRWSGFSEEDISKLKSVTSEEDAANHQKAKSRFQYEQPGSFFHGKNRSNIVLSANGIAENNIPKDNSSILNPSTETATSTVKVSSQLNKNHVSGSNSSMDRSEHLQGTSKDQSQPVESCDSTTSDMKPEGELIDYHKKSLTAKLVMPSISQPNPSSINLSDFRKKQRLMEEQNRARKDFLAKALEDRKKQTHAEQLRLSKIQEELQKLDQRLSCDVSIIRNQIEAASLEFMEAQKRYDRAEKEFLDAKLLLYTKLERKELLTHHLCTIIEQNEMRKAQKLSELMEKLQMAEDSSEILEEGGTKQQQAPNTEVESKIPSEKQGSVNTESKRKISSEIVLTPTSVALDSDTCRADGHKIAIPTNLKEHLST